MWNRIKLYWKNLKESQTMKEALIQKVVGALMVVEANIGYFQEYLAPWSYGVILISFGFLAKYRREKTRTPLSDK